MIKLYQSTINNYKNVINEKTALLTFETTGINKNKNSIYLISILSSKYNTSNALNLIQLLCEEKSNEKDLLIDCISYLKKFDTVILYNIKNYYLSFLQKRLAENNIQYILPNIIDIYNFLYSKKNILNLSSFKKSNLENLVSYTRQNDLTSIQALNLYKNLDSKNIEYEKKIKELLNFNTDNTLVNYKTYLHTITLKKTLNIKLFLSYLNLSLYFFIDSIVFKNDLMKVSLISDHAFIKLFYEYDMFFIESHGSNITITIKTNKAYLNDERICTFHDIGYINKDLKDKTNYDTPKNVLLLKIEDKVILENIKLLIEEIFKEMK